ncbi:MAG: DUF3373 family protein [Arcobacteraceae bacterium]|jgi:hypothetical protein|nr:DUF3373 family protein [Arcobacteraceae bacterium]
MKRLITLSAFAALTTSSLLGADVDAKISEMEAKITALEEKLAQTSKTLTEVKAHDATDNIKFGVDFRTAIDSIHYTHASGAETSNPDLLTNRLWLNMGYSPDENTMFKGKLSYLKAYGDSANHSQANVASGAGYSNFDWVTNENATDNTLKVKEAYWLYMNDTFMGNQVPWTISIGRRPSTDGLGINMREAQKENSPLSHTVNVEFDGLSAKFDLDKITGVKGMWWKLCTGRGLTNATPRFDMQGNDYAADNTKSNVHDVNMYGFIFVPYDNGQYSVATNWARAENLIGFTNSTLGAFQTAYDTYMGAPSATTAYALQMATPSFSSVGDMDLATIMFKAEGVGSEINDFLDNTRVFASWAQSTTRPKGATGNGGMLGSDESKTGTSIWIGANMPCLFTEDGRIGVEWNKGSKYWRSVTYGEDTMAGSKIAARGTAVEVYYTKPINKALSFDLRYTKIDYDYTGSNSFFGADGTPMTMAEAMMDRNNDGRADSNPVEKATDLRASVSYRF